MSANAAPAAAKPTKLTRFRSPGTVISRFVARRTMRSATLWAAVFGVITTSKSIGYASAYPTLASRIKVAASFSHNIGLEAMLGVPRHIEIVASGAAWNTMGAMTLIGSIWGFLLATKSFRGEEDAGRWELLLSGQTTAARAAANVLGGLAASLALLFVILAAVFVAIGSDHAVDFGVQAGLFFALSAMIGPAIFVAIGALASQLMPTRSRAASLSAAVFGVSFLLRATADTTSAHWLLGFTPLGWVEHLQPLYKSQPLWLLPIVGTIIICSALAVFLAGQRDLGASTFPDADSAAPRTALLGRPLTLAIRLTRAANLGWLLAIGFIATFLGVLTKSAGQAFSSSVAVGHAVDRIVRAAQQTGATTFLGIAFFMLMILAMVFTANAIGATREEEASGYLDNLLVRPVNRLGWLAGRLSVLLAALVAIGLAASAGTWLGTSSQHGGLAFHTLLLAGINLLAPAVLVAGIGVAAMGFVPRLTTVVAYTVIAWSFLIEILGSGLNLSHWVSDSSIFQHVALAPAVSPNWKSAAILAALGAALAVIGMLAFARRDLAAE